MKYENGADVLPERLLRQVQKYASGKLLYIPSGNPRRAWGETSGYKQYLTERNHAIRTKYADGTPMDDLAQEYFLAVESIKRIVYAKKEGIYLQYKNSLASARQYAAAGQLEEWVHTYLLSDGHNKAFSDGLKLFERYYLGPVSMPLALFERCCGPEEHMKFRVQEQWFDKHVEELMQVIEDNVDLPPLIVNYVDNHFELNDGNHRHEAYARLGIPAYDVIIWCTEKAAYQEFLSRYAEYL